MELCTRTTGALVVAGASFLRMPGIMKSRGETVRLALMPPQPAVPSAKATRPHNQMKLQFNLTCEV